MTKLATLFLAALILSACAAPSPDKPECPTDILGEGWTGPRNACPGDAPEPTT